MAKLIHRHIATDRAALIDEAGSRSFSELDTRANQLIHALRGHGIVAGDVIAIYAGNCAEYYEIMVAASHAGILYVPVNWHFTAEELAYVIDNSEAKLLFADAQFSDTARAAMARNETPSLTGCISVRGAIDGFDDYEAFLATGAKDEPEQQTLGGPMFYTSGTTGRPKGVRSASPMTSQGMESMDMMSAGLSGLLSIPKDGTTLLCGPVYHSAQWAFSFLPLLAGSTVVSRHRFDAAETLQLIDEYQVSNVHLVPTQFHRLSRLDDATRAKFSGKSLAVVWHGAAPCPPQVKRRMIDWWGPVINEYYGSTEGSIVTTATSQEWIDRPGTVGKPTPLVEVRIVGEDGALAPAGTSGQIYVKNRMGTDFIYHKEPAKTAAAHLEPGVFTFGDIGYLDGDGYLFMSDRKIDMIISGGVNIYPAEIEAVLTTHPAVQDAAVFGIPNEEYGEEVKAAIQVRAQHSPTDALARELIEHCRSHLAGYKAPKSIASSPTCPATRPASCTNACCATCTGRTRAERSRRFAPGASPRSRTLAPEQDVRPG
ncbi:MAG: AMP-binding protein, partial [Gammaproteobacteria bacterium]|nr:AMP-binding protein [Gammaproteobacteria bacterium]